MRVIDLCGEWKARCVFTDKKKFEFTGKVPGSAVNDLINANRLPKNIFWRDNADSVLEFEKCDYISLHVPLTDKTRGLVGAKIPEPLGKEGAALHILQGSFCFHREFFWTQNPI